jgi:hypothetical protein
MPADLDRQYAKGNLPDHAALMANIVRWTAKDSIPIAVQGAGFLDCNLYRQRGRLILHIGNLSTATWRAPIEEFVPIGPLTVRFKLDSGPTSDHARLLVADQSVPISPTQGWAEVNIPTILAHEVVVVS